MTESIGVGKVMFDEGLGEGKVIGHEDEGAIAECACSKSVDD
jgi:hypothetical protein